LSVRAYVVVNRAARRLRTDERGSFVHELRRHRPGLTVVETSSLAELDAFAASLARRGDTVPVVLAGGDGSHGAGVSALVRAFGDAVPPIALAPGGTVSTVARNWGVRSNRRALRRLLDLAAAGRLRPTLRPTLRVRGGDDERLGFIAGAGLVARFFEAYLEAGADGLGTAARLVGQVFAGSFAGGELARRVLTPEPCTVAFDGREASFSEVSLVCASVVRDLGLGMRLLYRAAEDPSRFHAVATPLPPRALGPQMPRVLAGRPLRGPKLDALTARLSLRFPPHRGAYVVDGELLRSDDVAITAGPSLVVLG
jgi:diacylglycerol kinase family enzyme